MSKIHVSGTCSECNSKYTLSYNSKQKSPEYCPFCGELLEDIDEEYIEEDDYDNDESWEE